MFKSSLNLHKPLSIPDFGEFPLYNHIFSQVQTINLFADTKPIETPYQKLPKPHVK